MKFKLQNMKTRSLLLMVFILIIGFILGFLSSSFLKEKKTREYRSYSSYESFKKHALDKLQPSEEQKVKLLPVIEKYSEKYQELKLKYRNEFRSMMNEYSDELKPFLTEEQLDDMERRRLKNSSSAQGSDSDRKYKNDSFYFCP